ncbi:glycosyltransferase [Streptomyces sp. WAC05374]|uniref:glycosyltransferase family 2 protein n=1 Tax=Streptomyces sp. WAC05374 TaxID=2487420 RepID=UPI000F85F89D|nr:glycosyltransferase [Streptomyces sp. WAC05374]RST10636.1 glycosyltransferase [Streptomyces sp. WAC05374]TDF45346.1 glycosyltransferase [Streptomyces sp. WAC05374]TDF55666.1 glycosyltransferase [Streptomyces sp. WAC05374]TDF58803.1 glycosyltransferase [Streptomyces sp. WAC05374]
MTENTPDVSVIIGAYDAMPYLVKCLESVEAQTIGADRIEVIAVDDGSTDTTGEYLEEFAARSKVPARVIRQANSGGPGGPRNTGLALARGRFVFFLDADDYLGEEALERLVAMADRAGTDVVLGKTVGVNRHAATSMWKRTVERADIYHSNVKYTLSAQKLFRRDLLVRHGMRFDESLTTGEDALFTLEAYLRGSGVSVVADPTCYYLVGREDGKHLTKTGGYVPRFDSARALMELIAAHVPPGERRELLMMRPFTVTLLPQFGPVVLRQPRDILLAKMELAAPLMAAHWTPGLADRLKTEDRLRLTCVAMDRPDALVDVVTFLQTGDPPRRVRRKGREYLAYPHFRDPAMGIPDTAYEVRGAPGPLTVARRRARRLAGRLAARLRGRP